MFNLPESAYRAFGTYDIRGIVGESLDESVYRILGETYAQWLRQELNRPLSDPLWLAIGYDARLHSPTLYAAMIDGLKVGGASLVTLGMVPTPLVYFTEFHSHQGQTELPALDGTITVTASHNPSPYNGVKFTVNRKAFDKTQLASLKAFCHQPQVVDVSPGQEQSQDIESAYFDYITQLMPLPMGRRLPSRWWWTVAMPRLAS